MTECVCDGGFPVTQLPVRISTGDPSDKPAQLLGDQTPPQCERADYTLIKCGCVGSTYSQYILTVGQIKLCNTVKILKINICTVFPYHGNMSLETKIYLLGL